MLLPRAPLPLGRGVQRDLINNLGEVRKTLTIPYKGKTNIK